MDLLTFILLVLILCVILFLVYYFFRGAKGDIALTRPVESRVDEYLTAGSRAWWRSGSSCPARSSATFKEQRIPEIKQDEARIAELKNFEFRDADDPCIAGGTA